MSDEPTAHRPAVRPHDWAVAVVVTLFYLVVWALLPFEWADFHKGGKWFLALFIPMAGLGALLASVFFTTPALRARDNPAVWLGMQVVFWNPIAFRAVVALTAALGVPSDYATVVALAGLVLLGLPTSLAGCFFSRSPSWTATYVLRALQCFFATWIPWVPPLALLHVVALAHAVTWERYGRFNTLAVTLVVVEQTAALLWFGLFYQFDTLPI
ncbi:hypothetical protein [Botrimarina sp.]|uniref:hypothetical protein n=1 Tax=Botrimarina sp. TaxID=2795802 RepID=UPI0032ECF664